MYLNRYHFTEGIARGSAYFGRGDGPIYFDNVECTGTETQLSQCIHNGVGVHNCGHYEDAGVICILPCKQANETIVIGTNTIAPAVTGIVQVCYNATRSIVCGTLWTYSDARVVCRSLGYSSYGKLLTFIISA